MVSKKSTSGDTFFRGTILDHKRSVPNNARRHHFRTARMSYFRPSVPAAISTYPAKIAHIKEDKLRFPKHDELQRAMNDYQQENMDDIMSINMMEKEQGNWNVVGLIDPNKHLSTLDHSVNIEQISSNLSKISSGPLNYHQWIPSVFQVNEDGTDCQLMSEIPQLDPYQFEDCYQLITELFLYQLPQFENILGENLRGIPLKVVVRAQDYQLSDCEIEDCFLGNFHKEGLYEDIAAVGLYYYQIDEGIKGGELELSSLIIVEDNHRVRGRTELKDIRVSVKEGTSLVF